MIRCVPLLVMVSVVWSCAFAQTSTPAITAAELREHVRYLASDELEGRAAGQPGNEKAAAYIAKQLASYGVLPGGDGSGYLQTFEFVARVEAGNDNNLALSGTGVAGGTVLIKGNDDILPLALSSTGSASGDLVFAGYGLSVPDKQYDDYAGLDVQGKIVVILRFGPEGDAPHSDFTRHTSLRNKARLAREKGAAGIVLITGPKDSDTDDPLRLSYDRVPDHSGIPAVSVKRAFIEPLLRAQGRDLRAIQDTIAATKRPIAFPIEGARATLHAELVRIKDTTANVIGYLPAAKAPDTADVVVIGAHFDHLGYGGPGSGSVKPDTIAVHNGADDNASGTSGLLEIVQEMSARRSELRRNVVFAFFSGEELGTLGSLQYVGHPKFPLARTVAMLNLDMVGRLTNKTLTVGGSGTSSAWAGLLARHNADSALTLQLNPDGFGPSDHAAFYGKDVPVLFFFTGVHSDYHSPADDADALNYEGLERVVRFADAVATDIVQGADKPAFVRVQSQPGGMGGDSRGFAVTLGIVPDYSESSSGMKISGVRANGAAEKAGLKSGDVIVGLAGKKILSIYDYMGILGELKAGDEVTVEVLRDGKPMTFKATMEKRR
jgi:aminopeptidase YwaD